MEYRVRLRSHKSSINKIKLLLKAGTWMAIGVIDYNWMDDPDKGGLHIGECYFGFLLQRSSEEAKWEKVDTDKVVFVESKKTKNYKLQVLYLLC